MWKKYIVITWRTLVRQKMYSTIKIGGFAIGIAACLLIALFISQELQYDLNFPDSDRIYRVIRSNVSNGETSNGASFPAPFAEALQAEFPDFEKVGRLNASRFFGAGEKEFRRTDHVESTHETGFVFMDQSTVDVFRLPFVKGNAGNALTSPNSVVITQRKAARYFPTEEAIGKTFVLNNENDRIYTITGVVEDPPVTSHLQYDFIVSLSGLEFYEGEQTNWRNSNYPTYVRLRPDADVHAVERKMTSMVGTYFLPGVTEAGGGEEIAWLKSMTFKLQPVHDVYLNSLEVGDNQPHGDVRFITMFAAIAVFILVIASINFINLSTARSATRAKEVGLRKVVGSLRINLIGQFLTESVVLSMIAFLFGVMIAYIALPYFNTFLARPVLFPVPWSGSWMLPLAGGCSVLVGIIAGVYPAFYLSGFRPSEVLKGRLRTGTRNTVTRSVLVIFQFAVSVILIAGTIIVGRQMDFMLKRKIGYDKEQVLMIQGTQTLTNRINVFKAELLRVSGVSHVTISHYLPVDNTSRNQNQFFNGPERGAIETSIGAQRWQVDHDYVKTLGLSITAGRDFSPVIASDSQALVINRSMVMALHLKEPIGKVVTNGWGIWTILGVVEDFNYETMKEKVRPLCLQLGKSNETISVKISTADVTGTIDAIAKVWKEFSPQQPVRYTFLDEEFRQMYIDVTRMKNIFTSFAFLAVVVACLGLFALSVFMATQRKKEISIRLMLGASLNNVYRLLTFDFMKLVAISLIIAMPLAAYIMMEWLKDYAYKINIGWDIFALTAAITSGIALMTVSYQAVRSTLANPADSLRTE